MHLSGQFKQVLLSMLLLILGVGCSSSNHTTQEQTSQEPVEHQPYTPPQDAISRAIDIHTRVWLDVDACAAIRTGDIVIFVSYDSHFDRWMKETQEYTAITRFRIGKSAGIKDVMSGQHLTIATLKNPTYVVPPLEMGVLDDGYIYSPRIMSKEETYDLLPLTSINKCEIQQYDDDWVIFPVEGLGFGGPVFDQDGKFLGIMKTAVGGPLITHQEVTALILDYCNNYNKNPIHYIKQ